MYLKSFCGADDALWVLREHATDYKIPIKGKLGQGHAEGVAESWVADVEARKAKVLARLQDDTYAGQPVVTQNRFGRGHALYAGAYSFDEAFMTQLFDYALELAKVKRGVKAPRHVEVIQRGKMLFAINHSTQAVTVPMTDVKGKAIVGEFKNGVVELKPYGVTVIKF